MDQASDASLDKGKGAEVYHGRSPSNDCNAHPSSNQEAGLAKDKNKDHAFNQEAYQDRQQGQAKDTSRDPGRVLRIACDVYPVNLLSLYQVNLLDLDPEHLPYLDPENLPSLARQNLPDLASYNLPDLAKDMR